MYLKNQTFLKNCEIILKKTNELKVRNRCVSNSIMSYCYYE